MRDGAQDLITALALIAGITLLGGVGILVAIAITGLATGDLHLAAMGVFLLAGAVAGVSWMDSRDVVYNDETARRRLMARRVAAISAAVAVIAFLVWELAPPL